MLQAELDEIITSHNLWLATGEGTRGDISGRRIHCLLFNNLDTYQLKAIGAEISGSILNNCNIEWPCLFGTSWIENIFTGCSFGQSKYANKSHYKRESHICKCYSKEERGIFINS